MAPARQTELEGSLYRAERRLHESTSRAHEAESAYRRGCEVIDGLIDRVKMVAKALSGITTVRRASASTTCL